MWCPFLEDLKEYGGGYFCNAYDIYVDESSCDMLHNLRAAVDDMDDYLDDLPGSCVAMIREYQEREFQKQKKRKSGRQGQDGLTAASGEEKSGPDDDCGLWEYLCADMADLRQSMRADAAEMRQDLRAGAAELRKAFYELRDAFYKELVELCARFIEKHEKHL